MDRWKEIVSKTLRDAKTRRQKSIDEGLLRRAEVQAWFAGTHGPALVKFADHLRAEGFTDVEADDHKLSLLCYGDLWRATWAEPGDHIEVRKGRFQASGPPVNTLHRVSTETTEQEILDALAEHWCTVASTVLASGG